MEEGYNSSRWGYPSLDRVVYDPLGQDRMRYPSQPGQDGIPPPPPRLDPPTGHDRVPLPPRQVMLGRLWHRWCTSCCFPQEDCLGFHNISATKLLVRHLSAENNYSSNSTNSIQKNSTGFARKILSFTSLLTTKLFKKYSLMLPLRHLMLGFAQHENLMGFLDFSHFLW